MGARWAPVVFARFVVAGTESLGADLTRYSAGIVPYECRGVRSGICYGPADLSSCLFEDDL